MADPRSPAAAVAALVNGGRLAEAAAAAAARVKAAPTSAPDRILLAELLMLQGALERADNQLKLAGEGAPAEALALAAMRWLLRGAEARRAWHEEGAVPSFLGEPTPVQRDAMRLALAVRAGDAAEASRLREALEARELPVAAFDGAAPLPFRDGCDLGQHGFEALAADGRYLWLVPEQVEEIRFEPVRRPLDLAFRRAGVRLADGRDAVFHVPALYHDPEGGDAARLGDETDWVEGPGGVARGRGRRLFLVGDAGLGLLDLERIAVGAAADSDGAPA